MEQRSDEWFAARCGKITGSRFASVMAIGAKGQPLQLRRNLITQLALERLTGKTVNEPPNTAMTWGVEQEKHAKVWYMFEKNTLVQDEAFIEHPKFSYVGVSPDGLIDDNGGCEFKCPYNMERHLTNVLEKRVPKEYLWQIQGCMWVTERAWWDFVSYDSRFPSHLQGVVVRVQRDDEIIHNLERECNRVNNEIDQLVNKLKE